MHGSAEMALFFISPFLGIKRTSMLSVIISLSCCAMAAGSGADGSGATGSLGGLSDSSQSSVKVTRT